MPIIIPQNTEQSTNTHLLFIHSCRQLKNLGGVMLPALFTWNIVHPRYYSLKITIHSNTATKHIDTTHNILIIHTTTFIVRTGISFFLFSKSLPMKVRQRTPMWHAKYRMGNSTIRVNYVTKRLNSISVKTKRPDRTTPLEHSLNMISKKSQKRSTISPTKTRVLVWH